MHGIIDESAYHQTGGASLINHRHLNPDSYEIIQVLGGDGSAFILDRTYPFTPGTLLFIDAASLHCITPADISGYARNKLILDKAHLHGIFEAIGCTDALDAFFKPHAGSCFYLNEEQSRRVDSLFRTITSENPQEKNGLTVMSALLNLFSLCSRSTEPVEPRSDDKLAPVMQYLRRHYAEPLSVDRIAAETHLSKYYLCHLFRKQTGLTLMEYLYEHRLSAARQQLIDTDLPISAIAQNCGFGSSSHFCTLFRKREGLSPRDFRKNHA